MKYLAFNRRAYAASYFFSFSIHSTVSAVLERIKNVLVDDVNHAVKIGQDANKKIGHHMTVSYKEAGRWRHCNLYMLASYDRECTVPY